MSGFGKANLDPQYDGFKYFKLRTPDAKKGETETQLIVRLLPSMKSYRDSGEWKFFYGQHYGYAGVNPRDPSKPRSRPFGCIQKKNKSKEVTERCPKCDQMSKMEAKRKAREDELAKQHNVDGDEARKSSDFYEIKKNDQKYQTFAAWLSKHNCDKKFWMNAMDKDGNFGVLQLSYSTTMEKLIPLLKKLASGEETGEKVDAFDPGSGMWLKFTRSGRIPRVVDGVVPYTELQEFGGKKVRVEQPAPMTQEQIEKALKTCPDLAKEVVKTISAEIIQALVDCNGDPEEVDRIWPPEDKKAAAKAPAKTEDTAGAGDTGGDDGLVDEDLTPSTKATEEPKTAKKAEEPKTEVKTQVKEEPKVEEDDDEEAALLKQLAEAKARKAAKVAAEKKTESTGLGKNVDNADAFLAQFDAQ